MKRLLLLPCVALLFGCLPAAAPPAPAPAPLRLVMSTDLHYLSNPSPSACALIPQLKHIDAITAAFLEEVVQEQPTALLLCGDLTNGGRPEEHRLLVQKLKRLTDRGVPVFALPGNHDLEHTSREDFAIYYRRLGYQAAISRDPGSLSYAAPLGEGWRLVALDTNVSQEAEGILGVDTLAWLETTLRQAQADGVRVVVAGHHNLLEHGPARFGRASRLDDGEEAAALLRRYGVQLVLSGHRHRFHISEEDGLHEVTGAMLASYPTRYGMVTLGQRDILYEDRRLDVQGWAAGVGCSDPVLLNFDDFSRDQAEALARQVAVGMVAPFSATEEERAAMELLWFDAYFASANDTLAQKKVSLIASRGYTLWKQKAADSRFDIWLGYLLADARDLTRYAIALTPSTLV